jgi:L,D-transpeptidase YcbB
VANWKKLTGICTMDSTPYQSCQVTHFQSAQGVASRRSLRVSIYASAVAFSLGAGIAANAVHAEILPAFTQSLATAAAGEDAIQTWYRSTNYATLWTSAADAERRGALLAALATAPDHGLPLNRYDPQALGAAFAAARTEGDRARLEVAMTRAYLAFARDLTSGILTPSEIDRTIVRDITVVDPQIHLAAIAGKSPAKALQALVPKSTVYAQLMHGKLQLEDTIASGGWGPTVAPLTLALGDTGPAVIALRDRLMRMGYLGRSITATYDADMSRAVTAFQVNHGLVTDGVFSETTAVELNKSPQERLGSVIVAMERERWLHIDRSVRHIWVNQPDFTAKIVDHGKTVFQTRVVIGKNVPDQRSPEFSDQMEFMVINPSWSVPRSITVKEYLPLLQRNPNAVSHLKVIDGNGRVVSRGAVNFAAYTARNFPFALRQPPSDGNALGKVKFMFPNVYNIYLHDTPSKDLFGQDVRAFSHGCIRVADPFDLAHELLSVQSAEAEAEFERVLVTGSETMVPLEQAVPVHLVYFTAYPTQKGKMSYRRDVYGRDAAILSALQAAGVVIPGVQG